MPGLKESMYCSQQIHIPPTYPHLLRQFAKAAIRTQPYDLLRWSCAYFRALSDGNEPPVKYRLEYPEPRNYMGLTPGLIKVLLRQFNRTETVQFSTLLEYWHGICLQDTDLVKILLLGSFQNADEIPFYNFIAVAVGHLNENLTQTMIMLCELLTEEPEGGSAMIPVNIFLNLYQFLATIDASKSKTMVNNLFFIPSQSQMFLEAQSKINELNMNASQSVDVLKHPTMDPLQKASHMPAEFEKFSDVLECNDETCANLIRSEYSITGELGVLKINKGMTKITGVSNEEVAVETTENFVTEEDLDENNSNNTTEDVFNDNTDVEAIYEDIESDDVERYDSEIVGVQTVNLPSRLDSALRSSTPTPTLKLDSAMKDETKPQTPRTVRYPTEPVTFVKDFDDKTQSGGSVSVIKYKAGGIFPPDFEYIDYYIEAIRGIGPVVDDAMLEKFKNYISERAQEQHGMIMPRNIRHFLCPPLENVREESEELLLSSEITKEVPVVAPVETEKIKSEEDIEDFDDDDDYGPPPCKTCECDCICKEDD